MKLNVLIKGFTQIEILINLLIFSMVFLGFYQLLLFQLAKQNRKEESLSREEEVSFWRHRLFYDVKDSFLISAKPGLLKCKADADEVCYEFQTGLIVRKTMLGCDSLRTWNHRLCIGKDSLGNICFVTISCEDSLGNSHELSATKAYSFRQLLNQSNSMSHETD